MAKCIHCDSVLGHGVLHFCSHECEVGFFDAEAKFQASSLPSVLALNEEDVELPWMFNHNGTIETYGNEIPF